MNSRKTYISYIVQTENNHVHYAEVVDLPQPETALYIDNSGYEVYRWAQQKQDNLLKNERIVVQNFFSV